MGESSGRRCCSSALLVTYNFLHVIGKAISNLGIFVQVRWPPTHGFDSLTHGSLQKWRVFIQRVPHVPDPANKIWIGVGSHTELAVRYVLDRGGCALPIRMVPFLFVRTNNSFAMYGVVVIIKCAKSCDATLDGSINDLSFNRPPSL